MSVGDENTLKSIMSPLISGLITAFTFCFSLSFVVFNTTIQRFGRESYDLLDKKPLLILAATFFAGLFLSVFAVAVPINENVFTIVVISKASILVNFLFFGSIVPYFFWLIDHVSSKSMLRNILENLLHAILHNDINAGEKLLKGLVETTFKVIEEHDHSSFGFFIEKICKIQSKLVDVFCRTPLNSQRRDRLESLWFSLTMTMGMIAQKACENDISYLNEIRYFHSEKLGAIFSSETSYGTLSPTFSDVIVDMELNVVYSLLCYLAQRAQKSRRSIGQKHMEDFFDQTFMSVDVISDATDTPANLLDYFYVMARKHNNIDVLLTIFEINIQLYPCIFSLSQAITSLLRLSITKILGILPEDYLPLAEAIVSRQELALQDLTYEKRVYHSELLEYLFERYFNGNTR